MALIRSDKFDPVSNMLALQNELDRFLRNPSFNLGISGHGAYPPVNIFDDQEGVVLIAEVPGMDPASIKVSGQNNTLIISGARIPDEHGKAGAYHRRERRFGEFSRSVQLTQGLDLSRASARYDAGILTVRVPKAEAAKPRQIAVQAA
ncbi:MAG TPA: Hsp20/alpha crystallin family protein [Candidatus Binataceae bacterium]|nr:Hsp20/alpha crystallin family protein [Candidatus Binataceae bacterium]